MLVAEKPLISGPDLNICPLVKVKPVERALVPLKDEEQEKQSIIRALASSTGNRTKAASLLNINPSTLYRKMKKYGIT